MILTTLLFHIQLKLQHESKFSAIKKYQLQSKFFVCNNLRGKSGRNRA